MSVMREPHLPTHGAGTGVAVLLAAPAVLAVHVAAAHVDVRLFLRLRPLVLARHL